MPAAVMDNQAAMIEVLERVLLAARAGDLVNLVLSYRIGTMCGAAQAGDVAVSIGDLTIELDRLRAEAQKWLAEQCPRP